ncbi:MAG: response regulator [Candidatus Latescibacterota bacterium]
MDSSMPGMDGEEATRLIHAELPHVRIIGLSMYEQADRSAAMLGAGASAYLSKSGDPAALLEAVCRPARQGGSGSAIGASPALDAGPPTR